MRVNSRRLQLLTPLLLSSRNYTSVQNFRLFNKTLCFLIIHHLQKLLISEPRSMEAVGGSVLSTTLQVLFDRIALNKNFLVDLFPENKKLQLKRLERVLQIVSPVLQDAENKQAKTPAVRTWFNGLKHAVYKADDVLDGISTDHLRIQLQHSTGNLSDTDFSDQFIGDLSPRLEEICDALERKAQQIGVLGLRILYGKLKREDKPPSTPEVEQSGIFGRDVEKEKIIQMVLSCEGVAEVSVIPITGMGGVGKTTLAQLVYNDEGVKNHFEARAWVCVSEEFDVFRVTKDLLIEVNSSVVDEKDDLNSIQVKLINNLGGKRFIIILDDIWNDNYNECQHLMTPLNSGSRGSKIIVTTRNESIALMLQNEPFHYLHPIPEDQSWSLFKLHAFDNRARTTLNEFEIIGRKIMEKCKGLPLAIKTVAGALRSKSDIREWRDILSSENWMNVGDILSALSLSFKLLPSHLKCCFAFCAVFPKDVPFDKEEVALLWMANDLVLPSNKKVAQNYFEELRSRSFFEMGNNKKYVMHDLINDLARIVSGKFCARIENYQLEDFQCGIQGEIDLPPEVLHFSYLSLSYDTLKRFRGLAQAQGLRTFLPVHQPGGEPSITTLFFSNILPKLRHIRAVALHKYIISVIPDSIGDLKHLRFLNLTMTHIKKLPNDITKCLNLQTLILAYCYFLEELPEDMGLLINLQHLDISHCSDLKELPKDMGLLINLQHLDISKCRRLKELPEDMGLLINLQHLDVRGVGFNFIDKTRLRNLKDAQNLSIVADEIHGSALEQLDELQLDKSLNIYKLDNSVTIEMAKKAELRKKNCIEQLSFQWCWIPECSEDELNVFSELIPHTNIRKLRIEGYRGTTFSNWLGDSSFCNIESLTIEDCQNCYHLPPLGQLTGLKRLKISHMDGVSEVGEEFYGNSSMCKPFPVLEILTISDMAEWTTWNTHADNHAFLSLKEFEITECPKLVGDIPIHLRSLRTLTMRRLHCNLDFSFLSPTISLSLQSCDLKQLQIEKCKHVKFLTYDICNSSLESLRICDYTETIPLFSFSKLQKLIVTSWESPNLFMFPNGYHQSLTSLLNLGICGCEKISSFPKGGLPAPNLKEFSIFHCHKLKSLPELMHRQQSSLRSLILYDCPEIECFPEGGLPPSLETIDIHSCKKLMKFPRNWSLQRLPSLVSLWINGSEDKLFPEEGLLPATLQGLTIINFPYLETLNHKGLQDITSLGLSISKCPELRCLPEDGLPSSLAELRIGGCPKLKGRIEREKGEDWPKVSHIPIIVVDGKLIS